MSHKAETPLLYSDLVPPGSKSGEIADDTIPILSWSRGSPYDPLKKMQIRCAEGSSDPECSFDATAPLSSPYPYGDLDKYFPENKPADDNNDDNGNNSNVDDEHHSDIKTDSSLIAAECEEDSILHTHQQQQHQQQHLHADSKDGLFLPISLSQKILAQKVLEFKGSHSDGGEKSYLYLWKNKYCCEDEIISHQL